MTAPAVDARTVRTVLACDLRTVAEYLLRRGWIAGDFETDQGVCLHTAIGQALPADRSPTVARVVEWHLHDTTGLTILGWNDRECADADQAVALLLTLANHLDGRQVT